MCGNQLIHWENRHWELCSLRRKALYIGRAMEQQEKEMQKDDNTFEQDQLPQLGLRDVTTGCKDGISSDEVNIGIDCGTTTTRVYVSGEGVIAREPSVVVKTKGSDTFRAVGSEAKEVLHSAPGDIVCSQVFHKGSLADPPALEEMLIYFITMATRQIKVRKANVLISLPPWIPRSQIKEALMNAGAEWENQVRGTFLIDGLQAATEGAGFPKDQMAGMIADIGGGTTDVGVISLGGLVVRDSLQIAGDEMDSFIKHHVRKNHNILINNQTAESIKKRIGTACQLALPKMSIDILGKDLVTEQPKTITLTEEEVRDALAEPVASIIKAVRITLGRIPPELTPHIMEKGIMLAGGGAQLKGLDTLISQEIGLPACVVEDPMNCVIRGIGMMLSQLHNVV